jgi:hypothetical protein
LEYQNICCQNWCRTISNRLYRQLKTLKEN